MAEDLPAAEGDRRGRVRDCARLVRPGILGMVLFTVVTAAVVAGEAVPSWVTVVHTVIGSGGVIMGAMALNARLERLPDSRMARTAGRPLASGRLPRGGGTWFAVAASALGLGYLAVFLHLGTVAVALGSWLLYVFLYTPLKRVTPWQTPVGAVAGAMPVILGAAAARAPMSPLALALFGLVFCWQLPHAMAIAWLYRDEFAGAESRVASVVDPSGRLAAGTAAAGALALVPVSLVPAWLAGAGWTYAAFATLVGLAHLVPSIRFLLRRDDSRARTVLRASYLYLPVMFLALLAARRL